MNTQTKELNVIEAESHTSHAVAGVPATDVMMSDELMHRALNMALHMSNSNVTIPKHLHKNQGDCFAVVLQSMQWGMNPFAVAQKTHIVNGTLGYEAQLVNAVIITRAPVTGRLQFDWYGDWTKVNGKEDKSPERGVRVWATLKGEDEPRILDIGMHQVGTVRNSPMWVADPRQQLAYLAIKRWSRLYCPDVILGVYTPDEFDEPAEKDVTPTKPAEHKGSSALKDRLKTKKAVVDHAPESTFDVAACIDAINNAQALDELKAIAKAIPADLGEPAKTDIKTTYEAKKAELSVIDAPKMLPPESIDAIEAEMLAAVDNEALDAISDSRLTPYTAQMNEADIDRLNAAYEKRMNEPNA